MAHSDWGIAEVMHKARMVAAQSKDRLDEAAAEIELRRSTNDSA
jgi:hypothetical protein